MELLEPFANFTDLAWDGPPTVVESFEILVDGLRDSTLVRFPSASDEVEAKFAVAARRQRDQSLGRLDGLVPALDWSGLANTTDAATFVVTEMAAPVESLDIEQLLDILARYHDPTNGRFDLAGGGLGTDGPIRINIPPRAMRPSQHHLIINRAVPGALASMVRDDQTLIINHIEQFWPFGLNLTADLQCTFGGESNVNMYISYGAADGFGAHWDDHDVLILQVSGRKYWEVFAPTALSPLKENVGPEVGADLVWSGTLQPGSALFIPRGWGHRVESEREMSVHLTVGVNRFRVLHIVDHLRREASNWPIMRADVPYDPLSATPPTSYAGSVFDEPGSLAEALAPMLPPLIERATAFYRAGRPPRPVASMWASLRLMTDDDWTQRRFIAPYPSGIMIVEGGDDSSISLACGGFQYQMDRRIAGVVAAAAAGSPLGFAEARAAAPDLGDERLRSVLRGLVSCGLLQVVS